MRTIEEILNEMGKYNLTPLSIDDEISRLEEELDAFYIGGDSNESL